MSASASSAELIQSTSAAVEHTKDDDVPHLGVLEEDDEFEEFDAAGASFRERLLPPLSFLLAVGKGSVREEGCLDTG